MIHNPFHPFNNLLGEAHETPKDLPHLKPMGHVEDYLAATAEYLMASLPEEIMPSPLPKAITRGTLQVRLEAPAKTTELGKEGKVEGTISITVVWDGRAPVTVNYFISGEVHNHGYSLGWEDSPVEIAARFFKYWRARSM